MSPFRETVLPNGLRVLAEVDLGARSVAVGFWVRTGARDEAPAEAGVSHFLEHMCFKGTDRRSCLDISRELDEMGARANAFTSWEKTSYYAQVLPEFVPRAVGLLADMLRPALRPDDFDLEKKVILEEIEMYRDRPDYLVFEEAMERRFAGHPLGIRILGTPGTIGPLPVEAMRRYHAERYVAGNVVFVAAGVVDWDLLVAEVKRACGDWPAGAPPRARPPAPPRPGHAPVPRPDDRMVHFLALWDGPAKADRAARDAVEVMSIILGDEAASRLHWALVHPGIAESVYAGAHPLDGAGVVYAGFVAPPGRFDEAQQIFRAEVERLRRDGPTAGEVERARTKHAARTVLRGESPLGRFSAIGAEATYGLAPRTIDEEIAALLGVAPADVAGAAQFLEGEPASVALGPVAGS